ncbi:uncharacterized protein LOC127699145 isoform X2 [Mytilus californianus]|uniref:uncharacterized protein LOC127699145 isoform X2 n=1 Tax=Mytilus californianus TaxID=6549 RepID=UPI00224757F8|nr:uncharacterized protein LOC127699145 isoform X2 [Mytilus californianus]
MEKDRILRTETGPPTQPKLLAYIPAVARLWTMGTLALMWSTSVTTLQFASGAPLYWGWYILKEGCCCRCWSVVMWIDNWKKGILYLLLTIPIFLIGTKVILGFISGLALIIAGLLYILKTFKEGIIYTVTETRYIKTYTPPVNVVSCHTQTEEEKITYEDFEPNAGYKFYRQGK